jgi:SAM-dependent methyltransferase
MLILTIKVNESNALRGLAKYFDLLSHRHPKMRILEIDGGVGTVTDLLSIALTGGKGEWSFEHLDYTDSSTEEVAKAKAKFASVTNKLGFKVLDIKQDPEAQGFNCGTYDMVVASLVLYLLAQPCFMYSYCLQASHQTPMLKAILENARKLLKT